MFSTESTLPVHTRPPDSTPSFERFIPVSGISLSGQAPPTRVRSQSSASGTSQTLNPISPSISNHGVCAVPRQSPPCSLKPIFNKPPPRDPLGFTPASLSTPPLSSSSSIDPSSSVTTLDAAKARAFLDSHIRLPPQFSFDSPISCLHSSSVSFARDELKEKLPHPSVDSVCAAPRLPVDSNSTHSLHPSCEDAASGMPLPTLLSSSDDDSLSSDPSSSSDDDPLDSDCEPFVVPRTFFPIPDTPTSDIYNIPNSHGNSTSRVATPGTRASIHAPLRRLGKKKKRSGPGPGTNLIFDAVCFLNMCAETDNVSSQFSDDPSNFHPHDFFSLLKDDDPGPRASVAGKFAYRAHHDLWRSRQPSSPLSVVDLSASVTLQDTSDGEARVCVERKSYADCDSLSSLLDTLHLSPLSGCSTRHRNITLSTYNCNGLANLVRRGYLRRFLVKHKPDVLLLTEVKMSLKRLFSFKKLHVLLKSFGYEYCYYNPQVRDNGGLHGTAVISKIKPEHVICGYFDKPPSASGSADVSPNDAKLSMNLDGRCITAVFRDFIVVNSYTPCSGLAKPGKTDMDVLARDEFRKRYDLSLQQHCENVSSHFSKPFIVSGDLNVTATRQDCYYRRNQCRFPGCKPWERNDFQTFKKSLGLLDAYRQLHGRPSKMDCTWWHTAKHWKSGFGLRLDYFLVPTSWATSQREDSSPGPRLLECYLDRDVRGSDHCPLFMTLSFPGAPLDPPVAAIHCDLKGHNLPLVQEAFCRFDPKTPDISLSPDPTRSAFATADAVASLCSYMDEISLSTTSPCPDSCFPPSDSIQEAPVDDFLYDPAFSVGNEYAFDKWADDNGPPDLHHPGQTVGCRHTRYASVVSAVRRAQSVRASVPVADVWAGRGAIARLRALFDTGAACSILSRDAFDRLRSAGNAYPLRSCGDVGPTFSLANGSTVKPVGWANIHLFFNQKPWVHKVYILEHSNFDLLLGVDFMSRAGANISFEGGGRGLITFRKISGDSSVPFSLKTLSTFRGSAAPLVLSRDISLLPRTQYTLSLSLLAGDDLSYCHGLNGQVDRLPVGSDARHRVPTGISTIRDGSVVCQISNFTDEPSFLPKGSVVAYFRPAWVVDAATSEDLSKYGLLDDVCLVDSPQAKPQLCLPGPDALVDYGDTKESLPASVVFLDDDADEAARFDDSGLHVDLVPKLKALLESGRVTRTQYRRLHALLVKYRDVFADKDSSPPMAHFEPMRIDIPPDSVPYAAPLRRYNPRERLLLVEHATRLLNNGVLERCNSAWRAQPLMIAKKDGGYRVALSYVRLNAMTKPVAANLPNLQDSLDSLGGAEVFTSCDILSAYYVCDLYEPHRDYTAFFVPTLGNLRFTRASMGLRNSQAYFVNLTMKMLQGLLFDSVVAYSDDLVSYSKSMDQHIDVDLPNLLQRVREYNVKLKASKVELCAAQFSWCGLVVDRNGVSTDPSKVAAIDAIELDNITTLRKLRSFVGSCNFLRRWIPKYSDVVDPLRILFKKGMFRKPDKWTKLQRLSFAELKRLLKEAPIMAHPDFSRPFRIYCDASRTCVAGALIQFDDENDPSTAKVIAYLSKALNDAQQNYHTHEQECLALLYCLETWRSYLFGQPKVTIYTDSKAVEWMCKPTSSYTGRCLRWILRASEWPLDVQHRSGVTHHLPDMLTRCVSEYYSKELKNPIEPLTSAMPSAHPDPAGSPPLPVTAVTRSMARSRPPPPAPRSEPPSHVPPRAAAADPGVHVDGAPEAVRDDRGDGHRRSSETFICYNCRAPHPAGEWACTHPCRACGARGHTRFACPLRKRKAAPSDSKAETPPRRKSPAPKAPLERQPVVGSDSLPRGDRSLRPFQSVFPDALDPQHILSLRPEIVLLYQVRDKSELLREHQSKDPFCIKVASTLKKAVCRASCTGCDHDKACPHYYWCYGPDGVLLRKSFREPVVSQQDAVRIIHSLRSPCRCSVSAPNVKCVHHSYAIRKLRKPPPKRRRRKRCRPHNGSRATPSRDRVTDMDNDADECVSGAKRARADNPVIVPADHLFSRRDVSSFDAGRIVEDFDRLLVCPRTYKTVIPATLVTSILYDLHGNLVNGHCGTTTCRSRARHVYWWKGMHKDITRWVSACLTCRRRKPGQPTVAGPPGAMELPPRPFHTIHIDHSGPWPLTDDKNTYILSIVDPYSRWPISVPVSDRKGCHVVRALLEYVIATYATPEVLVSDGAPEFLGKALADFCSIFQIAHRVIPRYSPSLNSPVERFHDWLNAMLTVLISRNKTNWDRMLPLVLLSYRTAPVRGVGLSPYQILYNRDPKMPSQLSSAWSAPQTFGDPDATEIYDVSRVIHGIVQRAHDSYVSKRRAEHSSPQSSHEYALGDFCLSYAPKTEITPQGVSNKPKLRDRWSHPRMVVAKGRKNTYVIQDANGKLYEVRPDLMVPYNFYFDGKPSIDSRPRYSAAERRAIRSNPLAYRPRIAVVGDLAVFPMSLDDDDAFGVGRVVTIDADGNMNFHWYGNVTDNLFGTYEPLWMRPDRSWYPGPSAVHPNDWAVLTSEYLDGTITQADLADVGFDLEDGRLPYAVIQRVSDNNNYGWCLDDAELSASSTSGVAPRN